MAMIYSYILGGQMEILSKNFYARPTVEVAHDLLGCFLVRERNGQHLIGKIVETEAYAGPQDPASHAYKKTPRSEPMYGPVGHAYIYFIYGNHFCFNVVARAAHEIAGGVLIRAVEPIMGLDLMKKNRNGRAKCIPGLTNGPGKLTQAFALDKKHNQLDLTTPDTLSILKKDHPHETFATERIGIKKAQDKLWRFCIVSNLWLSR